jgi:SAM-dependent methyltransferase
MAETWFLDELAHAGPEHLDDVFIDGYDRKQGFPDPAPDIAEFQQQGLDQTSTVVDLAAGTGQFAKAAANVFAKVIAVDVSPAMVRQLRRTLKKENVVHAGFLSYAHDGPPADGVYTRNALHQLPDFWKAIALDRIANLLRPGGVLRVRDLIYDFRPSEAAAVFDGWFAGAAKDPALGYTAGDYAEHIRTEHSTYRWLFEPMLDAAGFDIVAVDYDARLYGAYTCIKR